MPYRRRADRPLVKTNMARSRRAASTASCSGHVKGAFTGAVDKRVGRFEVANSWCAITAFDEIGEMPLDAQVKLLRVLQEQEFEPVGSSRTVRVDVRVIASTNRNLEEAVHSGTFRADLLYRLNVFPIDVPPLRARTVDIGCLARRGLHRRALTRRLGKPVAGSTWRLPWARLMDYDWPGNDALRGSGNDASSAQPFSRADRRWSWKNGRCARRMRERRAPAGCHNARSLSKLKPSPATSATSSKQR